MLVTGILLALEIGHLLWVIQKMSIIFYILQKYWQLQYLSYFEFLLQNLQYVINYILLIIGLIVCFGYFY